MDKIQDNNPVNDPSLKPVKNHSVFKPNYSLFTTHLFGMIQPHMYAEVVPDDSDVKFRTGTDIDTFSLKAPLMVPINAHKDHFFVPLRAILPKNADLLVTQPRTGDDVDASLVNAVWKLSSGFIQTSNTLLTRCSAILTNNGSVTYTKQSHLLAQSLYNLLKTYQILCPVLSTGSLARNLGYSFDYIKFPMDLKGHYELTFDEFFERIFAWLRTQLKGFNVTISEMQEAQANPGQNPGTFTNRNLYVYFEEPTDTAFRGVANTLSFRRFLQFLLQGYFIHNIIVYPTEHLADGVNDSVVTPIPSDETGMNVVSSTYPSNPWNITVYTTLYNKEFNLCPLIAYQLCCAQFYTDDAVDYVYDVNLWHENQKTLAYPRFFNSATYGYGRYKWNGISKDYDSVSGAVINVIFDYLMTMVNQASGDQDSSGSINDNPTSWHVPQLLGYFYNIMGYQRSLRYRDYFVGSKTSPLAVDTRGDTSVAVNNNAVNVVDVTKGIMMQKFLNQVNRIGRSLKNYTQGIFGTTPMKDAHEVMYLSSIEWPIGAEETANTGVPQLSNPQSVTAKLRSNSSRFVFTFGTGEHGYLIGVTYFDIPRSYGFGFDRAHFHIDRFDMFNPYLQHIGDQEVRGIEIQSRSAQTFGYQGRYMEYKQRVDRAAGAALANLLPGYALIARPEALTNPLSANGAINIGPDFIRSRPFELDQFYLSLTNCTMAGYFHFIIRHDNEITMNRPMEAAPSIL